MASFYIDRSSNESINSQWIKHLQANAYLRDIHSIVSQNSIELQSVIKNASSEQSIAIQKVCGTLEDGFREINGHLSDINCNISGLRGEINEMASMLDWKLSLLIEEQRVTNQLLGHIAKLLRVPESQKQKVYYIEQGLKYMINAFIEGTGSEYFEDSLDCFRNAEKIERKDYITLHRIGLIYLYSNRHLDLKQAKDYFLKSARESMVEANAISHQSANQPIKKTKEEEFKNEVNKKVSDLISDGSKLAAVKYYMEICNIGLKEAKEYIDNFNTNSIYNQDSSNIQVHSESKDNPFSIAAAEAYLFASRVCYLQQNLSEAVELARKAYTIVPEFIEAGFEQAKYLAANNQEVEASEVLETVIERDRYFSLKALNDKDLSNKHAILLLMEKLQKKAITKANNGLQECLELMHPDSKAKSIIDKIEMNISKNSFLSGMKALDLLNAEHPLPFMSQEKRYSEAADSNYFVDVEIIQPQKLIDFFKRENRRLIQSEKSSGYTLPDDCTTYAALGAMFGGFGGIFVGLFRGCTPITGNTDGSMDWGVVLITIIACAGIAAIIGFIYGLFSDT